MGGRVLPLQRRGKSGGRSGDEIVPHSGQTDSISAISDRLREFRKEREWERFHTPRNLAVSIAIESGELLEQFQWIVEGEDEAGSRIVEAHSEAIAEELADVMIYAVQLGEVLGISLGEAIESKIELNAKRYPVGAAAGSNRKYTELQADRASHSRDDR